MFDSVAVQYPAVASPHSFSRKIPLLASLAFPAQSNRTSASLDQVPVCLHAPRVRQQFFLLRIVAQAYHAQAFLLSARGAAVLVVPAGAFPRVVELFCTLNNYQLRILSELSPGEVPRSYKTNFMLGYAQYAAQILPQANPGSIPSRSLNAAGYLEGIAAAGKALLGSQDYPGEWHRIVQTGKGPSHRSPTAGNLTSIPLKSLSSEQQQRIIP